LTWEDGWTANIKSPWAKMKRRLGTMSLTNRNEIRHLGGVVDRNLRYLNGLPRPL
jgi:hypothetical protein